MEALTDEEGVQALCLARNALESRIAGAACCDPPLTPVFSEKRGVFVTLTRDGELRGCIGFPYTHYPLGYQGEYRLSGNDGRTGLGTITWYGGLRGLQEWILERLKEDGLATTT